MNSEIIQSLWIGPRLSNMEHLCIKSFIDFGHEFHLYTYDKVDNIPEGVIVKDGISIIISGTGGEPYDEPQINLASMKDCQLDFFSPSLGFSILRIQNNSLGVDFYNEKGFREYHHLIT